MTVPMATMKRRSSRLAAILATGVLTAAAFVLARFREGGDAQARAIWLYSRNDAIY